MKKLVYSYLVHHADANSACRELALLAINSFQRDLSDPNQLVRGLALRVLCGIRVKEIVQIQIMSIKKCATDSSPFVRKNAAHCVGKIFQLDADVKPELVEIIDRLLGDKVTAVLSSAFAAFNEVCPGDLALLHPHYRKLCALLADLDEWGQVAALGVLTRYARTQFANPEPDDKPKAVAAAPPKEKKKAAKKGKGGKFYDDDDDEDDDDEDGDDADDLVPIMQDDHALLLRVSLPLLRSRNTGVVLAVAALQHYVGPRDRAIQGRVGRALVRVMRGHREITYVVLTNIVEFARAAPEMFRKYIKDFFIAVRWLEARARERERKNDRASPPLPCLLPPPAGVGAGVCAAHEAGRAGGAVLGRHGGADPARVWAVRQGRRQGLCQGVHPVHRLGGQRAPRHRRPLPARADGAGEHQQRHRRRRGRHRHPAAAAAAPAARLDHRAAGPQARLHGVAVGARGHRVDHWRVPAEAARGRHGARRAAAAGQGLQGRGHRGQGADPQPRRQDGAAPARVQARAAPAQVRARARALRH